MRVIVVWLRIPTAARIQAGGWATMVSLEADCHWEIVRMLPHSAAKTESLLCVPCAQPDKR